MSMGTGETENQILNGADAVLGPPLAMELTNPALIAGDRQISYPDLAAAVARAGQVLRDQGVGRQDRVILLVDDRTEFFYAYYGAMKIGAVPIALNLRISAKEFAYIAEDSDAKLIIVDPEFVTLVQSAVAEAGLSVPILLTDHRPDSGLADLPLLMQKKSSELASEPMRPDDMALWMYTSGTTGSPKAVIHMVKSIAKTERYLKSEFSVQPGDVLFSSSKLFFAYAVGHILLAGPRLGATLVLHAGWPTSEDIAQVIANKKPDIVFTVPTLYRNLLRAGLAKTAPFKTVRHFISAGEHLPQSLFEHWRDATGSELHDCIGATENLVLFIGNAPGKVRPGSSGLPLPYTETKLLTENGDPVKEPDKPGTLWVKTETLAQGYWRQPDRSKAVFKDGWYCTNDVFTRDAAGQFYYQGRSDDMLKVSGQWVSPAEIEAHVNQNPDVAEGVVVGVENEEGLVRLALCLVPASPDLDRPKFEASLTQDLTNKLSIYKCPRRFVYLEEMPLTATGKVQRFKVRELAAAAIAHE